MGNRGVGAPEAAMRELSMWLLKKSRKVLFVNSNMRDDHVCLPKNEKALNEMEEEDDNVYMTSIHDRYAARPDFLSNMCLAKFAVNYEPVFDIKKEASGSSMNEDITVVIVKMRVTDQLLATMKS